MSKIWKSSAARGAFLAIPLGAALLLLACGPSARAQLTIIPVFGSDVADVPGEESAIDDAIVDVESNVTSVNPDVVTIDFGNMTSGLGESFDARSKLSLTQYETDLAANPDLNALQSAALATMPTGPLAALNSDTNVSLTAADFAAIGGNPNLDGKPDGSIEINAGNSNVSRTENLVDGDYDLQATVNHEIDEVLGIGGPGSTLKGGVGSAEGTGTTALPTDLGPLDLFRYSAPGVRSFNYDNSTPAYFSIDNGSTNLVYFNQQDGGGDYADWGAPPGTPGGYQQGNNPALVQDAFGVGYSPDGPPSDPDLGVDELTAFQVVGYNLVPIDYWSAGDGTWTAAGNWLTSTDGIAATPTTSQRVEFTSFSTEEKETTLDEDTTILSLTVDANGQVVIGSGSGGTHTLSIAGGDWNGIDVGIGANLTINSNVTLAAASETIEVDGSGTAIINGVLGGSNPLNKIGDGTLTLNGVNTFSGPISVIGGILQFGKENSLYADNQADWTAENLTVLSGGVLGLNVGGPGEFTSADITDLISSLGGSYRGFQNGGAIGLDTTNAPGGEFVYSDSIADTNGGANALGLAKLGSGTLKLTGNNTYSGQTTIDEGEIKAGSTTALSPNSAFVLHGSGILDLRGQDNTIGSLAGDGGTVTNTLAPNATLSTGANNTDTDFGGNIQDGGPNTTIGLANVGMGTLTLSGSNTYSGQTTLTDGEIQAGSPTAFSPNSAYVLSVGTRLDLSGYNETIGSLAGSASIVFDSDANSSSTLTVGADNTSTIYSGVIVDGVGQLSLTKVGIGVLQLAGPNTYTGTTTVNAGILSVNYDGTTLFGDISDSAVTNGGASSGALFFINQASAHGATITDNGGSTPNAYGGVLSFFNTTTAATASITNHGGSGAGAQGGVTDFYDSSTAGNSTITNDGGTGGGLGGGTYFSGSSDGGTASLTANDNGFVDISGLSTAGMNIGGIYGTGNFFLGSKTLTLSYGAASGSIQDGGVGGGTGGALVKIGTGQFKLGGTNTYTGTTTVDAGQIIAGADSAFSPASTFLVNSVVGGIDFQDGDLDLNGYNEVIGSLADDGAGGSVTNQYSDHPATLTTGANGASTTFSGVIYEVYGQIALTKIGAGTQTLTGVNRYTGPTLVEAGTLEFGRIGALYDAIPSAWNADDITVMAGATLALSVNNGDGFESNEIAAISALGTNTGGFEYGSILGLDTSGAGGNFTYAGVIADPNGGSNSLGLTKLGSGTLTLTGNNSYSGPTSINSGTLVLNNNGSTTFGTVGTGTVYVNGGGLLAVTSTGTPSNSFTITQSFYVAGAGAGSGPGGVTFGGGYLGGNSVSGLAGGPYTTYYVGGASVGSGLGGYVTFTGGFADADYATFNNQGGQVSGAGGGGETFEGNADSSNYAGQVTGAGSGIFNNDAGLVYGASGGSVHFIDGASAEQGTFNNDGGSVPSESVAGTTVFQDESSAGLRATFNNNPGMVSGATGGSTQFFNSSSAGIRSEFFNNSAVADGAGAGSTQFFDSSSGLGGSFVNQGALVNGAVGGSTSFSDESTAAEALLMANGGFDGGGGGSIEFLDNSLGGTATVELNGNGFLDISQHAAGSVSIGSLAGNGNVYLGSNNLAVGVPVTGNVNSNTLFSGSILDGGPSGGGGTGGSFTFQGNSILTLTGVNTYTGSTDIAGAGDLLAGLQFGKETALYGNNQAFWNAGEIAVAPGAMLALNVGGPGEFTSAGVALISSLGANAGGFQGGSILGLDTTNAAGGAFVYGGVLANTNGGVNSLGLAKLGPNTLTLTAANTYTGPTVAAAGTLAIANDGVSTFGTLGATTSALVVLAGASVDISQCASPVIVGSLSDGSGLNLASGGNFFLAGAGNIYLGSGNLTVGADNTSTSFSGVLQDGGIGGGTGGSFTKIGGGALTLGGPNTYTGPTTVNGGTLIVANDGISTFGSLGAGAVTVNGATSSQPGGDLEFFYSANAGNLVIFTTGGTSSGAPSGAVTFHFSTDAGSATILNLGGTVSGASGGSTIFADNSTADNAAIEARPGSSGGYGGSILFEYSATGGNAAISLFGDGQGDAADGFLDISQDLNPVVAIGSLEGNGDVSLGSLTLSIGGNNRSTIFSGIIQDGGFGGGTGGSLTKVGSGTLILAGQNSYTGATTLAGGILSLGSTDIPGISGPLGNSSVNNAGPIIFSGGTLQYTAANDVDYSSRFSTQSGQAYEIDTNGQTVTFASPLTSSNGSLTLTDSDLASPGSLILTAANTYTGPTTIDGGTLDIGGSGPTGSISSSSQLVLGGGVLDDTETGDTTQTFSGTTIGPGFSRIDVAAGDTVELGPLNQEVGGTVDFNGPGGITDDTYVSGVNNVLVSPNGTAFATFNGVDWATYNSGDIGTLSVTGAYTTGAAGYVAGNDIDVGASVPGATDVPAANFTVNTLRFNAAGLTLAISGANTVSTGGILVTGAGTSDTISGGSLHAGAGQEVVIFDNGSLNIAARIVDSISGPSALTLSGAGTLLLTGENTYTGVTTLNGGILNLGSAELAGYFGPLGDSPASNPGSIVFNGGTLQYSVNNQNDYSGRFSTAANQNIMIDTNGQTVTFATALTSSNGALTLNDSNLASPGALILTAASTYTGPTTVLGGTLVVSGSLNGTASTTVTNAALAGTGYIANSVTIGNALNPTKSALIVPGAIGLAGTLTIGDALTLNSDAEYVFNLDSTGGGAGNGSSELIAASLSLDAASQFSFNDIAATPGALTNGTEFTAIDATEGITGTFGDLANDSVFTSGPNTYEATYSSTELTLTVVPEPETWGMMISGFGLLVGFRKLRKRAM